MSTNLLTASVQWRNRPADERFRTLEELKNAVLNRRNVSFEGVVETKDLKVTPVNDSIVLDFEGQLNHQQMLKLKPLRRQWSTDLQGIKKVRLNGYRKMVLQRLFQKRRSIMPSGKKAMEQVFGILFRDFQQWLVTGNTLMHGLI